MVLGLSIYLFGKIITWPDEAGKRIITEQTLENSRLPGIVGYIDGTHNRLAFCPQGDQDYYNRKRFPSILLQVIFQYVCC